uniref:Uncharacterized protein n=1 Tax=Kalanchoe fedtschenkoi TaxID=63787 RepID=A0A7N0UR45_KALFE
MDFSEDWKSLFSANSVYKAPRLVSSPSTFGPLVFNPVPDTSTTLLSSTSVLPPLSELAAASGLSLSRFVSTSTNPESYLPPSLACSISYSGIPDDYGPDGKFEFWNNRLQLLRCPGEESEIVFFPVGENFDQVGFVKLIVKDRKLTTDGEVAVGANKKLGHRIVKLLVNLIEEDLTEAGSEKNIGTRIGNLMVLTMYSVHWFCVKVRAVGLESDEKPCLAYLGGKQFKSCAVADAAWSPHLPEESLVLLTSGELFLFDLNSIPRNSSWNKGKRFTALCNGPHGVSEKHKWFACEFSWHPRILVVGHEEAIFLLDLRFEESSVSSLVRIEALDVKNRLAEKDLFITLARAGFDGFHFVVASKCVLALIDVRKPLMPVLQWNHNLDEPTYVNVYKLSDLRSGLRDDLYGWATATGSCIILGSFWHNEFSVFIYGPSEPASKGSFVSKISEVSTSFYAWELPSEIVLTGHGCRCGSCLIGNEFFKDALPKWVSWQQKKEITLGFGIINTNMSSLLSGHHGTGGFTLVRLLSSGKLESEGYCASWKFSNVSGEAHESYLKHVGDNHLCSAAQDRYKFPRRFKYLKFEYLFAYLNGDINNHLISNQRTPIGSHLKKEFRNVDSYKFIGEELKAFGLGMSKSIKEVLEDSSFPTSVHELAVRRMWTGLPMNLLQLAFSNYSELLEVRLDMKLVSLEFLPVPREPELPPFFSRKCSRRSNKWSSKVKRADDIVGPLLPLPVLVSLQKASVESISHANQSVGSSYESKLAYQCAEVKKAAEEIAVNVLSDGNSVTALDNDKEDTAADCFEASLFSSTRPFFMYTQGPITEEHLISVNGSEQDGSKNKDDRHTTYICKSKNGSSENMEDVEQDQFADLCPVELKFRGPVVIGKESQRAFSLLKRQFSKWLAGVDVYQEFCRGRKYQKKA